MSENNVQWIDNTHCSIRPQHILLPKVPEMTTHYRSRDLGVVILSINAFGDALCVDFFQRADSTFGFEEYRLDVETTEGWFPIGFHSGKVFVGLQEAKMAALNSVAWLQSEM